MALIGLLAAAMAVVFLLVSLRRREGRRRAAPAAPRIVVDGTNVMFWHDNVARLETLQKVVDALRDGGFDPVVFLDASSRHHIGDRTMSPARFARALGIADNRLMVCPARTEADAYLLAFARDEGLPVVSNDRFRDRRSTANRLRLVRGRFRGARPVLDGL